MKKHDDPSGSYGEYDDEPSGMFAEYNEDADIHPNDLSGD
jgi:hypothetical protein